MSTKRLSKTVIEGGRAGYNKWERRHSHNEERVAVRMYCKQVALDPELAEEELEVSIKPVYKEFTDKLSPMYRWLDAQVGRPWSEVRSEVFQKFDTRTTAGRHITFDHLLRAVVDTESGFNNYGRVSDPDIPLDPNSPSAAWYRFRSSDYYVDQAGILQGGWGTRRRGFRYSPPPTEKQYRDAEAWLAGRMVIEKEGQLHWFTASEGIWKASWLEPNQAYDRYTRYELKYYLLTNGSHEEQQAYSVSWDPHPHYLTVKTHGDYWEAMEQPFSFRRRGALTLEEVKTFKGFPMRIRQDMLAYGKGR